MSKSNLPQSEFEASIEADIKSLTVLRQLLKNQNDKMESFVQTLEACLTADQTATEDEKKQRSQRLAELSTSFITMPPLMDGLKNALGNLRSPQGQAAANLVQPIVAQKKTVGTGMLLDFTSTSSTSSTSSGSSQQSDQVAERRDQV